jgi:hypothetical protein
MQSVSMVSSVRYSGGATGAAIALLLEEEEQKKQHQPKPLNALMPSIGQQPPTAKPSTNLSFPAHPPVPIKPIEPFVPSGSPQSPLAPVLPPTTPRFGMSLWQTLKGTLIG